MSELRWILGLVGVVVVVGLYLWGRHRVRPRETSFEATRVEPLIDGASAGSDEVDTPVLRAGTDEWSKDPQSEGGIHSAATESPTREPQPAEGEKGDVGEGKILLLYVRAASGEDFKGQQLLDAFEKEGLEAGKLGAFHYRGESDKTLFTVANMLEPGSFPLDEMDGFETGGIIMFMVLKENGSVDSLSRMIATARRLASILGGEVLDETRSTLTNQLATHMKEQAIEYLRKVRLEAADPDGGAWRS